MNPVSVPQRLTFALAGAALARAAATPGATKPMCAFPDFPRYRGGDVDSAASFVREPL